jgi:hypothetical protein
MDGTEPTQLVPKKVKRRADVGLSAVNLANVIPTWGVATFDFTITAPAEPGTYNFQWHMQASKGGAFGEAAPLKRISVVAPEVPRPASSNAMTMANASSPGGRG